MNRLLILALLACIAGTAKAAEKLADCKIESSKEISRVTVEKWPGGLPSGQQHLTTLLKKDGIQYSVSETFDGSGRVGLGQGLANQDGSVTFKFWAYGPLPLSFSDFANKVSVTCK